MSTPGRKRYYDKDEDYDMEGASKRHSSRGEDRERGDREGERERERDVTFRVLVKMNLVGSVIGKQGSRIQQMREDTGARIKIADTVPGTDERVIIVSCSEEDSKGEWTPAQEGLLRVIETLFDARSREEAEAPTWPQEARVLLCNSQVGSLIGKNGSIIKAIRESSGASVRILAGPEVPRCALPDDRLLTVGGELEAVRRALQEISQNLRDNRPRDLPRASDFLRDHVHNSIGLGNGLSSGGGGGGGGRYRGSSPPGRERGGGSPRGSRSHHHQSSSLPGGLSGQYLNQQMAAAAAGMGGLPIFSPGLGLSLGRGGRGSSSQAMGRFAGPNITSQITVPERLVGTIIGKGGKNINQVRQLSHAKVRIIEATEEATDRVVEMSGSMEEVSVAQQLLHGFLLSASQAEAMEARY